MTEDADRVKEIFEKMPGRFDPAEAADLQATYQFDLSGDGGGTYHVTITGGTCEVFAGAADHPDTTISMSAADYISMIAGKLNTSLAYMTGKLKIDGDLELAMKMQKLFPTGT